MARIASQQHIADAADAQSTSTTTSSEVSSESSPWSITMCPSVTVVGANIGTISYLVMTRECACLCWSA